MKKKIKENICFVAGKSGGHLIPAITIAQKLIQKNKELSTLFFTTNSPLDKKILCDSNTRTINKIHIQLPLGKTKYNNIILKHPVFIYNLFISFIKSFFYLAKHKPQKIISMGGLVSLPVCIAGFLLKIPIELFELNCTPGKAVKFLAPLATTIKVCFAKAFSHLPKKKCIFSQYPIRFASNILPNKDLKEKLKNKQFSKSKATILILGGSQGSLAINNIIKKMIIKTPNINQKIQIIHQTGSQDKTNWQEFYKKHTINAINFDYNKNISLYYNLADIVVCRSGAGTLFETIFFKKKCITIPLEAKTTDHQIDNAKEMAKQYPKLVTMIKQDNRCEKLFTKEIYKHIK